MDVDYSSIVIIGGGPSLSDFQWNRLPPSVAQIAVNMAFLRAPKSDFWFSEDYRVVELIYGKPSDTFDKHIHDSVYTKDAWQHFSGRKLLHALHPNHAKRALELDPTIEIIHTNRRGKKWADALAEGLSVSSNSAVGAVNVATCLGAERIYLLGIDCKTSGAQANYHEYYPHSWRMPDGQGENFASDFEHWAKLNTDRLGVKVVNVINPENPSALNCFKKISFEEFYRV